MGSFLGFSSATSMTRFSTAWFSWRYCQRSLSGMGSWMRYLLPSLVILRLLIGIVFTWVSSGVAMLVGGVGGTGVN